MKMMIVNKTPMSSNYYEHMQTFVCANLIIDSVHLDYITVNNSCVVTKNRPSYQKRLFIVIIFFAGSKECVSMKVSSML